MDQVDESLCCLLPSSDIATAAKLGAQGQKLQVVNRGEIYRIHTSDELRIPGHADQRSGLMAITIPGGWRSGFRADGDRCSGLMPISFRPVSEC